MRKRRFIAALCTLVLIPLLSCRRSRAPNTLALEECDSAGYFPCIQTTAFLSIPVADTNVSLTYSSRWTNGSSKGGGWDASALGLGGWSISLVQRYDRGTHVLMNGDGSWRLTDGVALPSGELAVPAYDGSVVYVFDSAGRHVRTVDGHLGLNLIQITYDSAGRIAKLDGNAAGVPVHVSVQRDQNGTPRALIGMDGAISALEVDSGGHLAGITDPAGQRTSFTWNAARLVESKTDPLGGVTRFKYDSSGQLVTAADADGVAQNYERKAASDSIQIRVSTPQERHWTYRAESSDGGILRTFTAPDGTTSTERTDSHGVRTIQLADGTSYTVGAVAGAVWGFAAPILTPVQQTRADGVTSRRDVKYELQPQGGAPYALAGTVTTVINGQAWIQTFDPAQRTAVLTSPAGRQTVLRYDENRRVVNYSAPGMAPVSYTYDATGHRISRTVGTASSGRTTRYAYDANSGQITVTRPDGTVEKTGYDKGGNAIRISDGNGSTTLAGYDPAGRLTQVQPPGGLNFSLGTSPGRRATGFVPPMVEGDASVETVAYDSDGRLSTVSALGGHQVSLGYDSGGRVANWTFDQGKSTASYDAHSGLVKQAADPSGVETTYGYAGRFLASLTWSGPIQGSVAVTRDANDRVARETVNGGNDLTFAYDPAGNVTGIGPLSLVRDPASGLVTHTKLGTVETTQEFDGNNQLVRATTTAAGKLVLEQRYTRDAMGRIKSVTETAGGSRPSIREYSYDRAGQLAAVRVNGRPAESYGYDPAGNRTSIVRAGKTVRANYDDRHRLVNWGETRYSWAADGRLQQRSDHKGTTSFAYDDFGALRRVKLADGREIKYYVDADGRRMGREFAGKLTGYLYRMNGSIAAEVDAAGKIVSRFGYDHQGHLALIERGGATYRVITDPVGSPRAIIDSHTGSVIEWFIYDPWGSTAQAAAQEQLSIGFAGGLRDPDTGLVRFGARDYDPESGRWTAPDPVRFAGVDANLYRYARGDPVNRTDRTGLEDDEGSGSPPAEPPPANIVVISQSFTRNIPTGNSGQPQGNGNIVVISQAIKRVPPPDNNDPNQNDNPPDDNPPQNGNPPQNDNPTPWTCLGGVCTTPDPGPGGCLFGSCNNGPNGFNCTGLYCEDPNGNSCVFCSMGDPHLRVGQDKHFDFQGAGEFLAAASADGKFMVQARQEAVLKNFPVTFNTAVAVSVNGDRVGVYAQEEPFLMINGAPVNQSDIEKRLPHGGVVESHGGTVNITWPDSTRLNVTRVGNTLNYGFVPGQGMGIALQGLLGYTSGNPVDLIGRDGVALGMADPGFDTKLYRQFGNSWRIKQSESLFHYRRGESTATFTNLNFPPKSVTAKSLSAADRAKAEAVCRAVGVLTQPILDDCILDVGLTGKPAFAAGLAGIASARRPQLPAAAAARSPETQPAAADEYRINIGDTVSPDHPGKGAGSIEKAEQKQSYEFVAGAGDNVYVSVGPCDGNVPTFSLLKPDKSVLDGTIGCHDFGPIKLPTAGTYRIVASSNAAPAHYTFSLRPAAVNQFSIKIGDSISPNHPAGAGSISQPGQKQDYAFEARAGQIVYLGIGPCEGAVPSFDLWKPDNNVQDIQIGCHDMGRQVLPVTGTYHIVARTDKDPGRYSLFLHEVPPDQHFRVSMPATVSANSLGSGAGRIAAPGAQQFYDFTGTPGATIHIDGKCGAPCPDLEIRVTTAGDAGRLGYLGLDHLNFDWTLPPGGRYAIQVRSEGYAGDYGFAARQEQAKHR